MREVFYASPWIPPEWIKAHGLEPRGIWQAEGLARHPAGVTAGVCAFADSVSRLALEQADSGFVFTSHCDQMRRACDDVTGSARERIFLFNLPSTWQTPAARQLYLSEMERLGRFLVTAGGHPLLNKDLDEAMSCCAEARQQLKEAAVWCLGRPFAESIARFHWDGTVQLPQAESLNGPFIPLAIAGGPLLPAQFNLLDCIEGMNGRVVLNATETGERSLWTGAATKGPGRALLDALVDGFFENCIDVFQRPNSRLYDWLTINLKNRGVRGLIVWCYGWCDLWRAEVQSLREAFDIPVLALEADECGKCSSRNLGQVQAFMETLRPR